MSQALKGASSGLADASGCGAAKTSAKTSEGKAAEVERLIAPAVEAMGYDIVRVQLSGGDRLCLQIMAERFRGRLIGSRDENIVLACEEGEVALPFAEMMKAKLVITDDLIAASSPKAAEGGQAGTD